MGRWARMTVWLLAVLAFGAAAARSAGNETKIELLSALDPAISDAATGGYWRDASRSGNYRIIILAFGEDHLVYETYAQWIYFDQKQGKLAVLKSTRIAELTDRVGAVVKNPRFVPRTSDTEGTVAEVAVVTELPPESTTIRIRLGGPGKYSVEEE